MGRYTKPLPDAAEADAAARSAEPRAALWPEPSTDYTRYYVLPRTAEDRVVLSVKHERGRYLVGERRVPAWSLVMRTEEGQASASCYALWRETFAEEAAAYDAALALDPESADAAAREVEPRAVLWPEPSSAHTRYYLAPDTPPPPGRDRGYVLAVKAAGGRAVVRRRKLTSFCLQRDDAMHSCQDAWREAFPAEAALREDYLARQVADTYPRPIVSADDPLRPSIVVWQCAGYDEMLRTLRALYPPSPAGRYPTARLAAEAAEGGLEISARHARRVLQGDYPAMLADLLAAVLRARGYAVEPGVVATKSAALDRRSASPPT